MVAVVCGGVASWYFFGQTIKNTCLAKPTNPFDDKDSVHVTNDALVELAVVPSRGPPRQDLRKSDRNVSIEVEALNQEPIKGSLEELKLYLKENKLGRYFDKFVQDDIVCKKDLAVLTMEDLKGYGMKSESRAKRVVGKFSKVGRSVVSSKGETKK